MSRATGAGDREAFERRRRVVFCTCVPEHPEFSEGWAPTAVSAAAAACDERTRVANAEQREWEDSHEHLGCEASRQADLLIRAHELARNQRRNADAARDAADEANAGLRKAQRVSLEGDRNIDEITGLAETDVRVVEAQRSRDEKRRYAEETEALARSTKRSVAILQQAVTRSRRDLKCLREALVDARTDERGRWAEKDAIVAHEASRDALFAAEDAIYQASTRDAARLAQTCEADGRTAGASPGRGKTPRRLQDMHACASRRGERACS